MASGINGAGGGGIFSLPSISSIDAGKKSAGVDAGEGAGAASAASGGMSFGDLLANKVENINAKQVESSGLVQDMATGKTDDIAQSMMRMQEASLELKMATQVRNKVIDAYQEILRMQI